jgi:DNA-binding transcriptional regulator YiaG
LETQQLTSYATGVCSPSGIVETRILYRRAQQLMNADDYAELQWVIEELSGAMKKELFAELLGSVKQAKAIDEGELKAARVVRVNSKVDIVRVRGKLGLSQSKFAAILGISDDTLQNWEQWPAFADGTSEGFAEDRGKASGDIVGSGVSREMDLARPAGLEPATL